MEVKKGSTLRRGGAGGRRSGRTINKMAVYEFALKCAIRAFHEQMKPQETIDGLASSSSQQQGGGGDKKDRRSSTHLGMSGMGDMLGSMIDGATATIEKNIEKKTDKLSKEMVRGLHKRFEEIQLGENTSKPEYLDLRFLTVIKQFQKVLGQHRYKPSGTVNDLVIQFLKISEAELKKNNPNPAIWYNDLNKYMARFAELALVTIDEDAPNLATPETIDKLNGFLGPSSKGKKEQQQSQQRSTAETNNNFEALEKYPMIQTIRSVFEVDDLEHRKMLRELEPLCTESAFLLDLKRCINNVHTNQPFPGRREDYASQQVYDNWQKRELKQLTELMKSLMLMNPKLSIGAGSETDVGKSNLLSGNRSSTIGSPDGENRPESAFTYIPNDPRGYYRVLMNVCIDFDMGVNGEAERAKASILSQQTDEVLRECWKTWRLSAPYRAVLYLELIKTKYEYEQSNLDDISDGIRSLDKVIKEFDVSTWAINDRESLIRVYEGLNQTLLHELADALSDYWKINPKWISDIIALLDKIYENPAYLEDHANPLQQLLNLEEVVEGAAVERWRIVEREANSKDEDCLSNLLTLADKLIKEYVSLTNKKFKTPLKDIINVPGIIMARQMPYFALEIENWSYMPDCKTAPIEVTFDLYHKVLSLKRLYDQHGPKNKTALFKVESWFLSHVRRWLITTNNATLEWVENAIKQDEFVPINETTVHSSSIVDLFSMFHQAVDFVQNLQWPNDLQHCRFLTVLSKVIGVAIEQYTFTIETMIHEDLFPKNANAQDAYTTTALFGRAQQFIGSRPSKDTLLPSDFTNELCIRLNDLEAARLRLDRLYGIVDADEVAEYMREHSTPLVDKAAQKNYLYSVKVVRAENLAPTDKNGLSDPYVVLEFGDKHISNRTKTMYETLNPRWDQTFDIWLDETTVDVLAVVNDEDLIGVGGECGAVWFQLSPQYFDDYQTHELVLKLHPQGKLILRVSMEGEKDDIQFWFGKAVRTLRRAENDTAGYIVDRMGRFMRQHLTRRTLDVLLGRERSFFSAFSRANTQVDPSLQDCEDCIAPVLDYLERNLKILNDHLSEATMKMVILKVWKDILHILEGIMLPPLSELQSDMIPLDEYEMHVVFKWLELLKILFNGGEDSDAVPLDQLENSSYHALLAINAAYTMETDKLIEGYNTVLKNQVAMKMRGGRKTDRSKTVYHSKHTMANKPKSQRKSSIATDLPNSETILRILRMRPGKDVKEFLHKEFERRNNTSNNNNNYKNSNNHNHETTNGNSIKEENEDEDAPPVPPLPNPNLLDPNSESTNLIPPPRGSSSLSPLK